MERKFKLISPNEEKEIIKILDKMLAGRWRVENAPPEEIDTAYYQEGLTHVFTQQEWTIIDELPGIILLSSSRPPVVGEKYIIFNETVGSVPSGFITADNALNYYCGKKSAGSIKFWLEWLRANSGKWSKLEDADLIVAVKHNIIAIWPAVPGGKITVGAGKIPYVRAYFGPDNKLISAKIFCINPNWVRSRDVKCALWGDAIAALAILCGKKVHMTNDLMVPFSTVIAASIFQYLFVDIPT
jgi:hypothetical protein